MSEANTGSETSNGSTGNSGLHATADEPVVLIDVADGVGTVTMNRPDARNAINAALRAAVPAALTELDQRDDVAAMVLTGAGKAFCAGLDLRELSEKGLSGRPADEAEALLTLPFMHLTKPLIGAINGPAVTGGLEWAVGCDFLVASERARFADTHARVNVMPGWGLTVLLPQAVGIRRARQMSFTGNFVDADTALSWGLVNEVVPHDELVGRAQQLARDIAGVPRESVAQIKKIYAETQDQQGTKAALELEQQRSREWQSRFDPSQLAADRAAIQQRGSGQTAT